MQRNEDCALYSLFLSLFSSAGVLSDMWQTFAIFTRVYKFFMQKEKKCLKERETVLVHRKLTLRFFAILHLLNLARFPYRPCYRLLLQHFH